MSKPISTRGRLRARSAEWLERKLRRELAACQKLMPRNAADARTQGQREMLNHIQAWLNVAVLDA